MKNISEKQIQNYLKEIAKKIPNDYPNKKNIIDTIRHNLYDFIEEHPSADFQDVIETFGSASDIADSFIENLSGMDINAFFQKKRQIKKILLPICIILFIVFIFTCRYLYYLYDSTAVIIEEIISIEETETM